ncbi:hypothetical protein ACLM5J_09830 [Nocardioides sp. Bht2]|uniref:hypothetical protein n=1 Tax=Nocardioides sp. Bht2 TaxID=3392297 RepID=UPI0039B69D0B
MSTAFSADDTTTQGGVLSASAQDAFAAELSRLSASSGLGNRDKLVRLLGLLLCVAGGVVVLLAYQGATGASDLRDQMELLVLAIFGLLLGVVGIGIHVAISMQRFLRFWLLRLVHEQRDLAGGR